MTDEKKRPDPEAVAAKDEGAKDIPNASDSTTTERPLYLPLTWNDAPKHTAADTIRRRAIILLCADAALAALVVAIAPMIWEVLR